MKQLANFFAAFFVALSLLATGCVSPQKQGNFQGHVDDSVITTRVKARLFDDANLRSGEINVETFKGVVQLSGFVSSRDKMKRAVEIARGIQGVNSVKNDMRLK